nr:MAG TPA: hypothetical protein [Caudoviricetes sp.]
MCFLCAASGCSFHHARLHLSEQNLLGLPFSGWLITFPQQAQAFPHARRSCILSAIALA